MSNIDEIIKKGLDGKGLPYQDAHWASMEKLIDKGGAKVGFFARNKLLVGIFLGLLMAGIMWFGVNQINNGVKTNATSLTENNKQSVEDGTIAESTENQDILQSSNDMNVGDVPESGKGITSSQSQDLGTELNNQGFDRISHVELTNSSSKAPVFQGGERSVLPLSDEPPIRTKAAELIENKKGIVQVEQKGASLFVPFANTLTFKNSVAFQQNVLGEKGVGLPDLSMFDFGDSKYDDWSISIAPYLAYNMYSRSSSNEIKALGHKANEVTLNAFDYGLDAWISKGGWAIRTGLGQMTLRENTFYSIEKEVFEYDTSYAMINRTYTQDGRGKDVAHISRQIDSTSEKITEVACEGCEVKLSYITLPLAAQYSISRGRFNYFGEAGLNTSFLRKSSGLYAIEASDSSFGGYLLKDISAGEGLNKRLFQGSLGIGARYSIMPRMSLWARYNYLYSFNSILSNEAQRPTIQSMNIGLAFKLK